MSTLNPIRTDRGICIHRRMWCTLLLLTLRVMVTVGGEEASTFPPSLPINLTKSSSLLTPSALLPLTHTRFQEEEEETAEEDFSKEGFPPSTTSTSSKPVLEDYGVIVTSPTPILGNNTKKRTNRRQFCNKNFIYLDKCLARIPPIPDTGIPSNIKAVDTACKAYDSGMKCVDDWTSKCLPKEKIAKFKASISGAHETFFFLCRDQKFKQEFLKHGDCYKKISNQWDECSKHFIDSMKRYQQENSTIHCCVRLSFLQCVSEISHYYCKKEAATFLQKMAETLVRATMRTHTPPQCVSVHIRNCSIVNSAEKGKRFTFPTIVVITGLAVFLV